MELLCKYRPPSVDPTVCVCNSEKPLRYIHTILLKYKALSGDMHGTNTVTSSTFLWNYVPV